MAKQYKLTQQRYDELKKELEHSKTVREKEVAELIKEARSFGDLSENAEYDEAKNEQGKLFSRMAELESILSNAVIIEEELTSDVVTVGCTVTIRCEGDDEDEEYRIVGSQEADPMENKISEESPMGMAVLGKREGEMAVVAAPAGEIRYTIVRIGN